MAVNSILGKGCSGFTTGGANGGNVVEIDFSCQWDQVTGKLHCSLPRKYKLTLPYSSFSARHTFKIVLMPSLHAAWINCFCSSLYSVETQISFSVMVGCGKSMLTNMTALEFCSVMRLDGIMLQMDYIWQRKYNCLLPPHLSRGQRSIPYPPACSIIVLPQATQLCNRSTYVMKANSSEWWHKYH